MLNIKLIVLIAGVALWSAAPAHSQEEIQGSASPFYFPWLPTAPREEMKGKWLVVKLQQTSEGAFQIVDLWFQDYDTSDMAVVDKIMSRIPPTQLGSYQLRLSQRGTQGMVEAQKVFSHQQETILENFLSSRIEHVATETELREEILVKVPIEKFDLTRPVQGQVRNLVTGATKDLPIPAELLKSLNMLPQEPHVSNSPTPWWLSTLESLWIGTAEAAEPTPLCDNLQVVEGMSNDASSVNRVNLIFVGSGYSTEVTQIIAKSLMNALFYQKPFDMNQQAFNAWVAPGNFPAPDENGKEGKCNCALSIKPWSCDLEQRAVISLCRKSCTSNANMHFQDGYVDLSVPEWNSTDVKDIKVRTWYHEFGHLFGGLRDEYEKNSSVDKPGFPNCAASKDEANVWWGDAYPKLQFFKGCSYTEDNYRFFDHSYMRHAHAADADYGNLHRAVFCMKLADITGKMMGPYCKSIGTPAESACNDGIDNDQDGMVDCQDLDCWAKANCEFKEEWNCSDGLDDKGDGAADCLDIECQGHDYSTQPSGWGSTSLCQGVHWKDRVLIKQKGPPNNLKLYIEYSYLGHIACQKIGMACDHIEVKVTNQPDGWFDVTVDKVFQESDGSYIDCSSWQSAYQKLPEEAGNFAFRAVCFPAQ